MNKEKEYKVPMNLYSQFLDRNMDWMKEVLMAFNELNGANSLSFCLYLDMHGWELFHMDMGKVIFRHEYKHMRALSIDIKTLKNAFMYVGCFLWSRRQDTPKAHVTWAVKYLKKIYTEQEFNYMFPEYEQKLKKQNLANRD